MSNPIPAGTIGRTDMGVDISAAPGSPVYDPVPGVSRYVGTIANWFQGQPYEWFKVVSGPFRGRYWYAAEQISFITGRGSVVSQGERIGTIAPTGTGTEFGYAKASGATEASSYYTEGMVTPAGSAFRRQIINRRGRPNLTSANTLNVPGYVPKGWVGWVRSAAQDTGLPASVVAAQINTESGFKSNVTSGAGAEGPAQFLPSTFSQYGPRRGNPYNPADAETAYVNYMNSLLRRYHGNIRDALAAYNAGPDNIQAGYGYADSILSKAGVKSGATAGSKSSYGATRPGGQSVNQGNDSGSDVDQLFASYEQEINAPRVAPPNTKNPFQWWWMSITGIWDQEASGAQAAGQGAVQGIQSVAGNG